MLNLLMTLSCHSPSPVHSIRTKIWLHMYDHDVFLSVCGLTNGYGWLVSVINYTLPLPPFWLTPSLLLFNADAFLIPQIYFWSHPQGFRCPSYFWSLSSSPVLIFILPYVQINSESETEAFASWIWNVEVGSLPFRVAVYEVINCDGSMRRAQVSNLSSFDLRVKVQVAQSTNIKQPH